MQTTKNHSFVKPELTDPADITQLNQNWDKIDEKLNDKDIFVVNFTESSTGVLADKTYNDIILAENNGKMIVGYVHLDSDLDYVPDGLKILTNYERQADGNIKLVSINETGYSMKATIFPNNSVAVVNNYLYEYSTVDLTAGTSPLETGKLYFVYE